MGKRSIDAADHDSQDEGGGSLEEYKKVVDSLGPDFVLRIYDDLVKKHPRPQGQDEGDKKGE